MLARRLTTTALISLLVLGCGSAVAQEEPAPGKEDVVVEDELVEEVPEAAKRAEATAALQRRIEELAARRAETLARLRAGQARVAAEHRELEKRLDELRRGEIELRRERIRIEKRIERGSGDGLGEKHAEMVELRAQLEEAAAEAKHMAEQRAAHEAELRATRELFTDEEARADAAMADLEAELTRARHEFALLHPEGFPRDGRHRGGDRPFGPGGHDPRGPGPRGPGPRGLPHGERGPPPRHDRGPGRGEHPDRPFRSGARDDDRIARLERAVRDLHEMLARHGFDGDARARGEDAARHRFGRRAGPGEPRPGPVRARDGERRPAPPPPGRRRGLPGLIEHLDDMTRRVDDGGEIHTPDQVERLRASMHRFLEAMERRRAADEAGRPDRDR